MISNIDERKIWSVKELIGYLHQSIEDNSQFKRVWLEAEISNFVQNSRSRHMYFTLKDDYAKVKSAMFAGNNRRLRFVPKEGDSVLVRGYLSIYDREGQIQFYVQDMRLSGSGDLHIAFEDLKKKLGEEGLFSAVKKKIPLIPTCVGVVTSLNGAALYDILTTLKRRFPPLRILVYPVSVQGEYAHEEIAHAIDHLNDSSYVDVLIVGRGGGSIEEIWAFNEEKVARSVYRSDIPIISAVGHETDTTIIDFVADIRAATPTAAAEIVSPHREEVLERLRGLCERMQLAQKRLIERYRVKLDQLRSRSAFSRPDSFYSQQVQRLDTLTTRLVHTRKSMLINTLGRLESLMHRLEMHNPTNKISLFKESIRNLENRYRLSTINHVKQARTRFHLLLSNLQGLSPLSIMKRGYALVYRLSDDALIHSASQVQKGELVRLKFADSLIYCRVDERIEGDENEKRRESKRASL